MSDLQKFIVQHISHLFVQQLQRNIILNFRELLMVDLIFLTVRRGSVDSARIASNLTQKFTRSIFVVAMLVHIRGQGHNVFCIFGFAQLVTMALPKNVIFAPYLIPLFFQTLMEAEPEKYQSHFSEYIKRGIVPDNMEEVHKKVQRSTRGNFYCRIFTPFSLSVAFF